MVQATNREYSEQTWQMARKMAGIDPTRVDVPTPSTSATLRDELQTIVKRLCDVRARLSTACAGLNGPCTSGNPRPPRDEPLCVGDDIRELKDFLCDIEQYAKEIEERIG